jgi:hypothetical protein
MMLYTNGKKASMNHTEHKGFITNRDLSHYFDAFGDALIDPFLELSSDDAIFDLGCGDACLSNTFFSSSEGLHRTPDYIGVTYSLNNRDLEDFKQRELTGKFHLFTGRYFESIPNSEFDFGKKIKIIVDYFGVSSYSRRLDLVFKKALELMDLNGVFIFGGIQDTALIRKYLESISGISFTKIESPIQLQNSYIIRVIDKQIILPELELMSFEPTMPPTRSYKFSGKKFVIDK